MVTQVAQPEYIVGEDGELRLVNENPDLRDRLHFCNENEQWTLSLDFKVAYPTTSYTHRLNSFLWERDQDDPRVRFVFSNVYEAKPIHVHQSRLAFVGGPLAFAVANTQSANGIKEIYLDQSYHPVVFAVIKEFLYARPIKLLRLPLEKMLQAFSTAHQMEIPELVRCLCKAIRQCEMMSKAKDVVAAQNIATLSGIPYSFKVLYWDCVARCFDDFLSIDVVNLDDPNSVGTQTSLYGSVETRLCPGFPRLWPLAVAEAMVQDVMYGILRFSKRNLTNGLLDLILQYLEPRLDEDSAVCNLLKLLDLKRGDCIQLLEEKSSDKNYSARAVRLLAKTIISALVTPKKETPTSQEDVPEEEDGASKPGGAGRYSWHCHWQRTYQKLHWGRMKKRAGFTPLDPHELFTGSPPADTELRDFRPQSIDFVLLKRKDAEGNMFLQIKWEPGSYYRQTAKKVPMVTSLQVWGNCKCAKASSSNGKAHKTKCLGSRQWSGEVSENDSVELTIASSKLAKLLAKHDGRCGVSIILTVCVGAGENMLLGPPLSSNE